MIRDDRVPDGEHAGRFNSPINDEVAAVIVGLEHGKRDIIIENRGQELFRIVATHPYYDALQYPLILWRGQLTYHLNLKQVDPNTGAKTNKGVSSMSYYSYQLMIRDSNVFLLTFGQLLNQYVVDMYAKIEGERLLYLRSIQKRLRADEYIHLRDAIHNDEDPSYLGAQVILPS